MLIPNLKYNYVIYGSDWDLYRFSYSDLIGYDNVIYYDSLSSVLDWKAKLHKLHFSEPTNRVFELPFKNIWNPLYFPDNFSDDSKPICFVFMSYWPRIVEVSDWTAYIKRKYKNSKCVLFNQDLVKTLHTLYKHETLCEKHFKYYDCVLSFDQDDCQKFGFIYHPLVFSKYQCVNTNPEYDVYFLGQAKNRLRDIISAFEHLRSFGLKLDFNIIGVQESEQVYQSEIHYIQRMNYLENLKHVENSKSILEIMQKGGAGFTQRGCEAVCLNKRLITNNKFISKEKFFNGDYIIVYDDIKDLNKELLDRIKNVSNIDYKYSSQMSPVELVQFIDNRLNL